MKKVVRKICLLGAEGVGKTSIVGRYVEDSFSEVFRSTIGVSLSKKTIVSELSEIVLMVWDLEGGHDPKNIPVEYLEGAHGAIAVVDLSRPETYARAVEFSTSFLKIHQSSHCVLAVNKSDIFTEGQSQEKFKALLRSQAEVFTQVELVSAKTGLGVEKLFSVFIGKQTV